MSHLNGGANCHNIGFHQHLGECWNDALSMLVIYNDGIGDYLQTLFNSFQINDTIEYNIHKYLFSRVFIDSPTFLLPYNIPDNAIEEPEFTQIIFDYINAMAKRYLNDKKKAPVSAKEHSALFRQSSLDMSLTCAHNIIKLSNINKNRKQIPKNGGNDENVVVSCGILNYTLLYPFDICISPDIFNLFNMSADYLDDCNPNYLETLDNLNDTNIYEANKNLIPKMNILLEKLTKYNNILFNLNNKLYAEGHATCFFTCNGRPIYYDDNGFEQVRAEFPYDSIYRTTLELNIKQICIDEISRIKMLFENNQISLDDIKTQLIEYEDKFILRLISRSIINKCNEINPGTFNYEEDNIHNMIFIKTDYIKISILRNEFKKLPEMYKLNYEKLKKDYYLITQNLLEQYEDYNNTLRIAEFEYFILTQSNEENDEDDEDGEDDEDDMDIDEDEPLSAVNKDFHFNEIHH